MSALVAVEVFRLFREALRGGGKRERERASEREGERERERG
jgi:hypothetical protein